jgi:hypothetical protein
MKGVKSELISNLNNPLYRKERREENGNEKRDGDEGLQVPILREGND